MSSDEREIRHRLLMQQRELAELEAKIKQLGPHSEVAIKADADRRIELLNTENAAMILSIRMNADRAILIENAKALLNDRRALKLDLQKRLGHLDKREQAKLEWATDSIADLEREVANLERESLKKFE